MKSADSKNFTHEVQKIFKRRIKKERRKQNLRLLCWIYSENAIDTNVSRKYSFEIAYSIDSTQAKVKTLVKINELSS